MPGISYIHLLLLLSSSYLFWKTFVLDVPLCFCIVTVLCCANAVSSFVVARWLILLKEKPEKQFLNLALTWLAPVPERLHVVSDWPS